MVKKEYKIICTDDLQILENEMCALGLKGWTLSNYHETLRVNSMEVTATVIMERLLVH